MKVYLLVFACLLSSIAVAQRNTDFPKLGLELGAGYEYANLSSFNETYIAPIGYGKFLDDLNSGWSVNLRTPLKLTPAVDLAMLMNFRQFRKRDETSFEYTALNPYNIQINQVKLFAFEGGIQTTVYIDQFWRTNNEKKLNVGVFGSASYAFSKLRTYVFRKGEGSWATFTGEQLNHFNTTFGMALRYNMSDSYFSSIVLNTGFNCATANEKYDVDFNGFFTRFLIGMGR